ncbi:MAG TPA: DUF4160 domain-containing protein [Acetobacteraceae bacterium]|nr:DUF4160 domain-containing protein [Acetobacteraceae bacterium]
MKAGAGQWWSGRMPTVARVGGFRIYFHSHEGTEPPHVHIDHGGATPKVWLRNISLANQGGFSATEPGNVLRLVR